MEDREQRIFEIDFKGENSASLPINPLQTSVFPVVLTSGDAMRSVGTCFAISNHGLCLTAKHVIDDIPTTGCTNEEGHALVDGNLGILYISPSAPDDGTSDLLGGIIPMVTAHTISGVDIAVMYVNLPVDTETGNYVPFPVQRLRLDFPNEGDRLLALGYEQGEWSLDSDGARTLSQTFTASTGLAREIHPAGRDRVVLPTPCFRTSAPFRSGMSGGPILTEDGYAVGVISTGFEVRPDEDPISYGTPLAPCMGITLNSQDPSGARTPQFLWDFAQGGALIVDQGEVFVRRTAEDLVIKVETGEYRASLRSHSS